MAKINDIMTRTVSTIELGETLQTAAQRMRDLNIGALPVTDEGALVGMVTDRDITIRAVAEGRNVRDTLVSDAMTADVQSCSPSDSVDAVLKQMGDAQLRRLAVLDADHRIVGIVALADLATKQSAPTDAALREISERTTTA
ncbi:MAG: CBS domain-containing protein [Burkholderiales bacterium]